MSQYFTYILPKVFCFAMLILVLTHPTQAPCDSVAKHILKQVPVDATTEQVHSISSQNKVKYTPFISCLCLLGVNEAEQFPEQACICLFVPEEIYKARDGVQWRRFLVYLSLATMVATISSLFTSTCVTIAKITQRQVFCTRQMSSFWYEIHGFTLISLHNNFPLSI